MGQFYFHLYDAAGLTEDFEGIDLPDLTAARARALMAARAIISAGVDDGLVDLSGRIEIVPALGAGETMTFRDAVRVVGP